METLTKWKHKDLKQLGHAQFFLLKRVEKSNVKKDNRNRCNPVEIWLVFQVQNRSIASVETNLHIVVILLSFVVQQFPIRTQSDSWQGTNGDPTSLLSDPNLLAIIVDWRCQQGVLRFLGERTFKNQQFNINLSSVFSLVSEKVWLMEVNCHWWRLVRLQIRGNSSGGRGTATSRSRLQLSHQLFLIRGTRGRSAQILQRARQKLSEKLTKLQNNFVYFNQKSCWRKGNIIHPDCWKILAKFRADGSN